MPVWTLNSTRSLVESKKKKKKKKKIVLKKSRGDCGEEHEEEGVANFDLWELRSLRRIVKDSRESYSRKSSNHKYSKKKDSRSLYRNAMSSSSPAGVSLRSTVRKSEERSDKVGVDEGADSESSISDETSGRKNRTAFDSEPEDEDSLDIRTHCKRF